MIKVKTRAHRALRGLKNFEQREQVPEDIKGLVFAPEESLLGLYKNLPPTVAHECCSPQVESGQKVTTGALSHMKTSALKYEFRNKRHPES